MIYKNRKLNRYQNWDYTSPDYYFVTICVKDKQRFFANFISDILVVNSFGIKVKQYWD